MRFMKYLLLKTFLIGSLSVAMITGCRKDYYVDSGLSTPSFDGNMLEFLQSKPYMFDTLVHIIKTAGLQSYFTDSTITFFAPADSSIRSTFLFINRNLRSLGHDTLTSVDNIKPEFWRNTLMMYMFRGARGMEHYPQLDMQNLSSFSGEFVRSAGGRVMNVGVNYGDANGIKYIGYRSLYFSYIPNPAAPYQGWWSTRVATSNVKPRNGYCHVLVFSTHYLGFDPQQTLANAMYIGFQ
ncbi:MAG: hypothetical protein J7599_19665 [Niabella sp.]|nr:hypothetical protein [Niabella sp.]